MVYSKNGTEQQTPNTALYSIYERKSKHKEWGRKVCQNKLMLRDQDNVMPFDFDFQSTLDSYCIVQPSSWLFDPDFVDTEFGPPVQRIQGENEVPRVCKLV